MKKIFYLYKSGTLHRRDSSLVLVEKNGNVIYLPVEQVDMIICFNEISLNKRMLALLNREDVCILFYNYYGEMIGRFSPRYHNDGRLILKQVETYQNPVRRLFIAKCIQKHALKNMISLLKYYMKKGVDLSESIIKMEKTLHDLEVTTDIEKVLILEAKAHQIYFSCFDKIIRNPDFMFIRRSKNPPENPLNAMLSYGYAVLYGLILGVLDRSRLLPQISFIHSLSKSTDSLKYDLADILKPVLIDRLVIRMIRRKQMRITYFEYSDNRCYMTKQGCAIFVKEIDLLLKSTVKDGKKSYSYKSIISREVHKLSNYIQDESNGYNPYVMKW